MRLTVILAAAAILMPAAFMWPADAAQRGVTQTATDLSAAKKKKAQKAKAKKEEYLKAAPSAPPSTKY